MKEMLLVGEIMKYDAFEIFIIGAMSVVLFFVLTFGAVLIWPNFSDATAFGIFYISVSGGALIFEILDREGF